MLSNTKLKRAVRLRAMFGGAVDEQSIRADHSGARAKSRAGWARTAAPTSGPSVAEPALTRLRALELLREHFRAANDIVTPHLWSKLLMVSPL